MALDTEAIFVALAERLSEAMQSSGVKSVTRRPRAQYVAEELPVIIIRDDEGEETLVSDPDAPEPVWRLMAEIQIHARAVETDESPTSQLNAIVKAVREALEFSPTADTVHRGRVVEHYTTLGGRVRALAIVRVEKGMGAFTGQPSAQLTITMEAREGA